MKNIGGNRSTLGTGGTVVGAGGGNSNTETITQTLTAGANDVSHSLGSEPKAWLIQDATGRVLTYEGNPKSGSETTVLEVDALVDTPNAKITVFGETSSTLTKQSITQTLNAGSNDVNHSLGVQPSLVIVQDSTGRILTYASNPKSGSETTVLEVDAIVATTNAKITVFA
jgi:hypothetical protein